MNKVYVGGFSPTDTSQNKGITLIALVITIMLMVLIAGVTVSQRYKINRQL